jgi:acyl transferase domain-containing protein
MGSTHDTQDSDIAIVGMACRFPGADSTDEFWRNLCAGHESTTFFTDQELLDAGVDPALLAEPHYVRAGQILRGAEQFDAEYFGITSEEAQLLDPQQRVFLECAVHALENAGHLPDDGSTLVGVYAGVGMNTYLLNNLADRYRFGSTMDKYRLMLASDKDFLATRTAYKLNLRGPSVNVSTACSTSLVAVHLACLSLLGGECDLALAGSAHITIPQATGYLHQQGMIFSPDGRCRPFDARAQGTVVGDGVGVVVLKRLADAVRDGDLINAVIKGTAINNDGSAKTGYTAPSITGQIAVINEAQSLADCPPDTISYLEAHGTATPLGDAVELAALRAVFRGARRGHCAIGSVKSNIGHLDTAAGMAGLIKTALMLRHRRLVPSLHFTEPNPALELADSPFYVNTASTDWTTCGGPLRAGVSSFGVGGANAHAVLEEAPEPESVGSSAGQSDGPSAGSLAGSLAGSELLVISARSAVALEQASENLARHLRDRRVELSLADVAHTLAVGRRAHEHRRALVSADLGDAALTLMLGDADRMLDGLVSGDPVEVAFVFFGQPDNGDPAEFVRAQCALADRWASWGVHPSSLIGFGVGEFAAASVAGVFLVDTAMRLARSADSAPDRLAVPALPVWLGTRNDWLESDQVTDPAGWLAPRVEPDDPDVVLAKVFDGTGQLPLELRPGDPDLLREVGRLWTLGVPIDWPAFRADRSARRVPLPTYPFQRKRYWLDPLPRPAIGRAESTVATEHAGATEHTEATVLNRFRAADGRRKAEIVLDFVRSEVADMLGLTSPDSVDLDGDLFGLGFDSLNLLEIAASLGAELEENIPVSPFGEHPTIRGYVDNLAESQGWLEA